VFSFLLAQRKKEKSSGGAEKKRAKSSGSSKGKSKGGDEGKAAAKPKKAKKDKNAPKGTGQTSSTHVFWYTGVADRVLIHCLAGALGSYMFFVKDERAKVVAENPGMPVTEVSKVIGTRWKELSAEAKAQYEALAKGDKERYVVASSALLLLPCSCN
jgi:structure-specific recognition protein 1